MADSSNVISREIDKQELETKLDNLSDAFETTKRKLEQAESKLAEFKLRDQAKSRVQELESRTKEKHASDRDKELVNLKNEIKTLEDQKFKATSEVSKLTLKVKKMETELSNCKVDAESIADFEKLRSHMKSYEEKEKELQKLYDEEKFCNTKLQDELKVKQGELSASLIALETIKTQGDTTKIGQLLNEVQLLQFEKDALREESVRLEEEKLMLTKDFVRFCGVFLRLKR